MPAKTFQSVINDKFERRYGNIRSNIHDDATKIFCNVILQIFLTKR